MKQWATNNEWNNERQTTNEIMRNKYEWNNERQTTNEIMRDKHDWNNEKQTTNETMRDKQRMKQWETNNEWNNER